MLHLNQAERHYSTVEKELLSIVWAIKHFRPYVYGNEFLVCSDHKPLIYLFKITNSSDRLMRWRIQLEEYDFKVTYVPGKGNVVADGLSRIELCKLDTADQITSQISDEIKTHKQKISNRVLVVTRNQAKTTNQNLDDSIVNGIAEDYSCFKLLKNPNKNKNSYLGRPISNYVSIYIVPRILDRKLIYEFDKNDFYSTDCIDYEYISKIDKHFVISKDRHENKICMHNLYKNLLIAKENLKLIANKSIDFHFVLSSRDEILWPELRDFTSHIFSQVNCKLYFSNNLAIRVSSKEEIQTILKELHNSPLGNHEGVERTIKRISDKYTWKTIRQDVKNFVKKCKDCQKNKILPKKQNTTKNNIHIVKTFRKNFP